MAKRKYIFKMVKVSEFDDVAQRSRGRGLRDEVRQDAHRQEVAVRRRDAAGRGLMRCPRCSSNIVRAELDRYGEYLMCLRCGWTDNAIGLRRKVLR